MPDTTIALTCPYCLPDEAGTDEECTHLGYPYSELFAFPDRHPHKTYGFICSVCGRDVGAVPCPEHAPMEAPGLRLIECAATPQHVTFVHARDDYGVPCPWCMLDDHAERDRLARQCRHWPWRRWRLVGKIDRYVLHPLRITRGRGVQWGDGCDRCTTLFWRWSK